MDERLRRPSQEEIPDILRALDGELAEVQKDWDAEREQIAALRAKIAGDPESSRKISEEKLNEIEEVGKKVFEGREKYLEERIKRVKSWLT